MTTAPTSRAHYTPEDLELLPEPHRFELRDGVLSERNMSFLSGFVAQQILGELAGYARDNGGAVIGDGTGLQIFADEPGRVVFPDGGHYTPERKPRRFTLGGWGRIAPDLVIEVVSPNDNAQALHEKVLDYLEAGVRMVWVAYPSTRRITVFHPDGASLTLTDTATMTGGDVLPGLAFVVGDVFPDNVERDDPAPEAEDSSPT